MEWTDARQKFYKHQPNSSNSAKKLKNFDFL